MSPRCVSCLLLIIFQLALCHGRSLSAPRNDVTLSSSGKYVRGDGCGGASKGIIPVMVLIEIEQSIKRYLLAHPEYLPTGFSIAREADFDINLADFIDCMSGGASGGWNTIYLASRGGQGASRAVLDNPAIAEKYGVIHTGGAEGLRVLYKEYTSVIYPLQTLDFTTGIPLDHTNPMAPGSTTSLYTLEGLESALRAFLGKTTLADCDTSLLITTMDLSNSNTVLFVQNAFKSPSVTSSAQAIPPTGPRSADDYTATFAGNLIFDEGKNYYLSDIGAATASLPAVIPAKNMTQVGSDEIEFTLVEGFGLLNAAFTAAHFAASETGQHSLEHIAVIDIDTGAAIVDRTALGNAGLAPWFQNLNYVLFILDGITASSPSLTDYIFYSNPAIKPFQYLRIQTASPIQTERGMLLASGITPTLIDALEQIGIDLAIEFSPSIDIFVANFVFG